MNELERLARLAEMKAGFKDTTEALEAFIEALQESAISLEGIWQDYYDRLPWYEKLKVQVEMRIGSVSDCLIAYWNTHFPGKRLRHEIKRRTE